MQAVLKNHISCSDGQIFILLHRKILISCYITEKYFARQAVMVMLVSQGASLYTKQRSALFSFISGNLLVQYCQ